ncbi:MAG: hypothetical protein KAI18_00370 [Candidatus Aenigmarchaeota archaeon]|nr:hypothetical protein [Candidatus Aenigmarchaeota archaeon]
MDSTDIREFEQPIPIDNNVRDYLLHILSNAEVLLEKKSTDSEKRYDYPGIGEIKLSISENLEYEIQFSPEGWYRLYNPDEGNILKDISACMSNIECYEIKVNNKYDKDKSINLTLDEFEKDQLYLNAEYVRTNSEECIKILQTVWNNMIDRFNQKCMLLEKDLEVPVGI